MSSSMSSESVCRVCLAGGVRMLGVGNSKLIETYEILASSKFQISTNKESQSTVCYICHQQLQKCHRFSDMARRSDTILKGLLQDSAEVTQSIIVSLNLDTIQQFLSRTTIQHVSTDDSNSSEYRMRQGCTTGTGGTGHQYHVCIYRSIKEEELAVKVESTTNVEVIDEIESRVLLDDDATDTSLKEELTSIMGSIESTSDNEDFNLYCEKCNKKFKKLIDFKIHKRIHTKENPFNCTTCSKTFHYAGHLNRHMRSHIKSYVCDRCSKKFKLKSALQAHLRTHTGEKPFACEVCGKTFNQRSHLKTHIKTHTDDKQFPCDTCGKAFRQRAQLVSHGRTHTGERPFPCNRCDMTFGHLTTLRKHMRLHTEVKMYPCGRCPSSFEQECALSRHMRVHTAARPHACGECNKSFLETRHLKEHQQAVHSGARPHVCACGTAFKRPDNLKQHARSSKCKASFGNLGLN